MPSWQEIGNEIRAVGSPYDIVRRKYLAELHQKTGRNVIVYYSGWLQKNVRGLEVNDDDKNGFMAVVHGLDRTRGLDLVLHTPGGGIAATESLVEYLRSMFGTNIRAIVPQLAMSAGTMIACSCREILMGKHSRLGPIDPQYKGLPAHGVIEEFRRAFHEIKSDADKRAIWQPIIARYDPTFIGECEKSVDWSNKMTAEWLKTAMFAGDADAEGKARKVVEELGDHAVTLSHDRHIPMDKCRALGLKISAIEDDQEFQDKILSVHHACIHTLSGTDACKIIENHASGAYLKIAQRT